MKTTLITLSIILALSASTFFLARELNKISNRYQQFEQNMHQTLNQRDQRIILYTQKQFKTLYPYLDSIIQTIDIKHIQNVTHTTYLYEGDTTIIELSQPDPQTPIFYFSHDTSCLHISGIADINQKKLHINKLNIDDEITIILHQERRNLFGWRWTPKWGRKEPKITTHTKCKSDISTINITISP